MYTQLHVSVLTLIFAQNILDLYRVAQNMRLHCFITSIVTRKSLNFDFYHFCHMMLCKRDLCCHAMCVCVSITFVRSLKTNKHIFKFFNHHVATPF